MSESDARGSGSSRTGFETLIQHLADFRTRGAARRELVQAGPEAIPALAKAAAHPLEGVRWSALQTLAEMDAPEALDALIDALANPRARDEARRLLAERTGVDLPSDGDAWRHWRTTGDTAEPPAALDTEQLGAADTSTMADDRIMEMATAGTQAVIEKEGDLYRLVLPLDQGRSQQVIVSFGTTDEEGEPTVYVYTECGPAAPEQYDAVFRRNLTIPYGRIAVRELDGRDQFVMCHQTLRKGLNLAEMRKVIRSIAKEGDALELELTRQDVV